ncbi:MAG TPA: acyl-CoA dehydrogenase [Gammaproteobacteria bacterium]|nr:acyl-CoA dehydrogenase [Gammaproteobacteria bacterium]
MSVVLTVIAVIVVALALAWFAAPLWLWSLGVIAGLAALSLDGSIPWIGWGIALPVLLILNVRPLRRALLSNRLLVWFRSVLPPLSETEQVALDAGNTWWDAELFTGRPDWKKLLEAPAARLTEEEQAFIDGPVDEFCKLLDDWKITAEDKDLPPEAWDFIRKHKLFGMIIPKEYGGLEFSALANSTIVMKIATRSLTAGVTVMVPNSLGPGELLTHYGTDEQKKYYLPRLANGEEIPCFALTSPWAGSDAGGIPDIGIVCEGEYNGRKTLGFRVSWDKRYITLAPVATVLGMAFKAYDPDGLLGDKKSLGITLALIPTDMPGVEIGNRANPLDAAFMNGTTRGKDVFIPMDMLIGGQEYIGQGWKMLMNCLSAGRAISLPALGTGAGKISSRMTGAYSRIRKQFRVPIGRFEGVEEALTRIAGLTYRMDAMRRVTAAAIDMGNKPSVLSAILKYHATEGMRQVLNDAMDIHGGRGVILGPRNYLGRAYQGIPIAITVEGANILTRSMIIFGQGAIRCHPFLLRELEAAYDTDQARARINFDRALFSHIGFTISNAVRALVMGLTGSLFVSAPAAGPLTGYYRQFSRMSSAFTFLADVTLLILGGELKRKEKLSARFGDVLSHLYMGSTVLKTFEDSGRPAADLPMAEWALQDSLFEIQKAMEEILQNYPSRFLAPLLKFLVLPFGRPYKRPNDRLGRKVADILLEPSEARDRLTRGAFINRDPQDPIGRMEVAFEKVLASEPIEAKLVKALKARLDVNNLEDTLKRGVAEGVITEAEAQTVREGWQATFEAILTDEFTPEQYREFGVVRDAAPKQKTA